MNLKPRLQAVANMIGDNISIYDIGCDHAYLDIYLMKNRSNIKCTAIDVRPNVISIAKQNILATGLDSKIKLLLNDGLNNVNVDDNSIVVLAGLGTNTILKLIKNKKIANLIIQSNDDLFSLRHNMINRGYYIYKEDIVLDNNKYYVVINFKIGKRIYNHFELLFGPILLKNRNKVFIDYLNCNKNKYIKLLKRVPKKCIIKRLRIRLIILYISIKLKRH